MEFDEIDLDLFLGIEIYYKMLYNIDIEDRLMNKAYHLQIRKSYGPNLLFEIHKRYDGYFIYDFISRDICKNKHLNNIDELKQHLIKCLDNLFNKNN